MAGANEVAVLAEPAVAHVVEALLEVGEFVEGCLGGVERFPVAFSDVPDDAVRAAAEQQALEEPVFLFGPGGREPEREAQGVGVLAGVVEVVGEHGVREGVAQGVRPLGERAAQGAAARTPAPG